MREIYGTRRKDIIRLILSEGPRFPAIAEFYYREVIARVLAIVRPILARAAERGELPDDALARFPQLIVAPMLVGIMWHGLFDKFEPLDVAAMMRAHIGILFAGGRHERASPRAPDARARARRLRQRNNGRLQGWVEADFVFVGPDEAGRVETLDVREGDTGRGRRAAVRGRCRSAAGRRAHGRRAGRRSARAARAAEVGAAAQGRDRGAAGAGEARGVRGRALDRRARAPADACRQGIAAQAQLDTAKANSNRDKAALEEVRRQITVAQMASRDEDIAAARQSLAAAQARQRAAETKLARRKLASPVERRGAAGLFPAGRDGAGRPAGAVAPAAGQHQGALLRAEAMLPKIALGDTVEVTCDGCAADRRAGELHRALGRIHPAGDLQPGGARKLVFLVEARPEHAGRPARRPAGQRRAQGAQRGSER